MILIDQAPFQAPTDRYDQNKTTEFQLVRKRGKLDFLTGENFKILVCSKFPECDGNNAFRHTLNDLNLLAFLYNVIQ